MQKKENPLPLLLPSGIVQLAGQRVLVPLIGVRVLFPEPWGTSVPLPAPTSRGTGYGHHRRPMGSLPSRSTLSFHEQPFHGEGHHKALVAFHWTDAPHARH